MMPQQLQIKRTATDAAQPTGLLPGELSVEMGTPTRLWVGVPVAQDPTEKKLLFDSSVLSAADAPNTALMYGRGSDVATTGTMDWRRTVAVAGDTMIGDLAIDKVNPAFSLKKQVSGESCNLYGYTGGNLRWAVALGSAAPESASSTGSDFIISRFDNSGAYMNDPFAIERVTGRVVMSGDTVVSKVSPLFIVNKSGDQDAGLMSQLNGGSRWFVNIGNADAELGGNSGSNFALQRYADDGSSLGAVLTANRVSGALVATGGFSLNGGASLGSAGNVAGVEYTQALYFEATGWGGNIYMQGSYQAGVTGGLRITIGTLYNFTFDVAGNFTVGTGTGIKPGGGAWAAPSDGRVKDVLGDYAQGLAAIQALNPVRYRYKTEAKAGEIERVGLVAQDAETAMPEMVATLPSTVGDLFFDDMRILDTTALPFALVNACKELAARIEALESVAAA